MQRGCPLKPPPDFPDHTIFSNYQVQRLDIQIPKIELTMPLPTIPKGGAEAETR
jgi:hypothetical protein